MHTLKHVKLKCLLGFLRNNIRDGQREKGIRRFQHFTSGSRPWASLFSDLEMATAHTAALATCWDLFTKLKQTDTLKKNHKPTTQAHFSDEVLDLGRMCTKKENFFWSKWRSHWLNWGHYLGVQGTLQPNYNLHIFSFSVQIFALQLLFLYSRYKKYMAIRLMYSPGD